MADKIKKTYKISGMDCASCAMVIESDLEDAGVVAKCDFAKETLEIEVKDHDEINKIKKIVEDSGYTLIP